MHDSYPFEIQWKSVTSTARQVNVCCFFIIIVNTLHWVNTSVQSPFHDTCIYMLYLCFHPSLSGRKTFIL